MFTVQQTNFSFERTKSKKDSSYNNYNCTDNKNMPFFFNKIKTEIIVFAHLNRLNHSACFFVRVKFKVLPYFNGKFNPSKLTLIIIVKRFLNDITVTWYIFFNICYFEGGIETRNHVFVIVLRRNIYGFYRISNRLDMNRSMTCYFFNFSFQWTQCT